ncbi:hypothetical protein ABZS99_41600 [Streptomyces sp. NPDC005463]|uniref:WXG100-like domain-containing protein n=1 Tax=Streptomyces sp. NPDC005463 TaxID=3154465 RepID=UPI0033A04E49
MADKAKKIVRDMTGMWWPDADEDGLRHAAKVWRDFADDLEDVTAAANKSARGIITHNKSEAISAFDDPYSRRYYYDGHGWLQDVIDGARDRAKSLDQYADAVHHAVKRLEHELEIVGATIAAGTLLAVFTAGISEAAAATATATIVDLAVTQPVAMTTGESKSLNLDEAHQALLYGALTGGALGGAGATYRTAQNAGGMPNCSAACVCLASGRRSPSLAADRQASTTSDCTSRATGSPTPGHGATQGGTEAEIQR